MIPTVSLPLTRGRKRQRRQLTPAAAERGHSGAPPVLPRVERAPANLGTVPASDVATMRTRGARAKSRRPQSPEFMDSSNLDAQISMLALIRANGYGSVPGTPLLRRGVTARSSSSVGGLRCRDSSARRVRDIATAGDAVAVANVWKGQQQSRSRGGSDFGRANRDPWKGPLDAWEEVASSKALESNTIERQELRRTKAQRLASVRGRCLLSQVDRVLHRRDLSTTAQLLGSARAEFLSAGDPKGTSEADEMLVKIKADTIMETIQAARKCRDYDRLKQLMFEALHYSAILARLGQVNRHDTLGASERRDAYRRMHERLRHPLRLCREYALEDGRKSREAAVASARKRKYTEARAQLEDARLCFDWAGNGAEELQALENVEQDLKVRENTTCGDRLTEGVAGKLQFLTPKDYAGLFLRLSEAAAAYEVAKDHDGAKVVRIVKAALNAVQSAECRWMQATAALKERQYSSAAELLTNSKLCIADASKGLPFVSPSLARASKILTPPGGVLPLDIVAELAALDGLKDHIKSIRALKQGMLDKAQQLNTSAREVFEFVSSCRMTSNRTQSGGGNSSIGKSRVGARRSSGDAGDTRGGSSPAPGDNACGVAEEALGLAPRLPRSGDELKDGEALLLKIYRFTSAPTNPDNCTVKPRANVTVHPGVRHRVEDLLDEISETEDVITRNKALERGEKLMATFWAAVTPSTVAGGGTGVGPAAVCSGAATTKTNGGRNDAPTSNAAAGGSAESGTGGDVNQRRWETQQVPGPGGALSPETASRCLELLADARDAYEGQGFSQQADGAGRLRAALLADRFLAKAQAFARSAGATATTAPAAVLANGGNITGTPPAAGLEEPWLARLAQSGGNFGACGHDRGGAVLAAAKAAAREAEDNYSKAANPAGALVARRTGMSIMGDEAMLSITPLLQTRAYDAVVEGLDQARRFYADAGPQGLDGLCRIRDPLGLVKAVAMRDGKRLKGEAVRVLRDGDVDASSKLCEQAQSCFSFADREGLVDATADVYAAIHMVTRLSSGDAVVVAAEAALAAGESEKAAKLLREAKLFFHHAQLSYEDLVDQVTTLLEEHPNDLEVARKATELQDNINRIYDSRRDGHRAVKVERCLDCLAADASLDNLAQVVDHEQFEDARTLLSAAALVYQRSTDQARLSKVHDISSLVDLVENASRAFEEGRYADAEGLVAKGLVSRAGLVIEQPLCLRPPDCALFRGGEKGAKTAVLLRVRAAGEADRVSSLELLEAGSFEAAERAAASACKRFEWWACHHPETSEKDGTGGGERCTEREQRQAVITSAKELMASVAAAASKARAERLKHEGRDLKSMGKFVAAVKTLRSAAELFHAAGLAPAAVETRAEASRTQAEALLLTSAELQSKGRFEAIEEHLQSAESLLLEAAAEIAGSPAAATATITASVGQSTAGAAAIHGGDGNVKTINGATGEPNDSTKIFGGSCGGEIHAPSDQGDSGRGQEKSCRILEGIVNLRSRVAGDIVMAGVGPALDARDYDKALLDMLEAERHYAAVKDGRWTTSVAAAFRKDSSLSTTSSPKELVMKKAAQDGDKLRGEAALAIQKEKNPVKARELLTDAEACMAWAGVDPFAAGAVAVSKDIRIFESRAKGDEICKGLIRRLQDKDFERAKGMLEEALTNYRQGDAFKQIADTQAVAFCVEREPELCSGVNAAFTAGDPAAALKTLEDARPVFQIAAELRSAVLREAADLIAVKHRHMTILSALCRAWIQCVTRIVPVSGDEGDVPDSAAVLDGAFSDVRALVASEALVLDVPLELLQDARERLSTSVATSTAIPPSEAADVGVAGLEVAPSEDKGIPLSHARNAEHVHAEGNVSDNTGGGAGIGAATPDGGSGCARSSDRDARSIQDKFVGKRMSRDVDRGDEVEDENFLGNGVATDLPPQNGGSGSGFPEGTAGGGLNEADGNNRESVCKGGSNVKSGQGTARQNKTPEASSVEKTDLGDAITERASLAPADQGVAGHQSVVKPVCSSPSSATSVEGPPSCDAFSSALRSLEAGDPLPLSSSAEDERPVPAHRGDHLETPINESAERQHLGVDPESDGYGIGNPEHTTENEAARNPDTAHVIGHADEASEDSKGRDVASIAGDSTEKDGDSIVGGRKRSTSISTKSSVEQASVNSGGFEAAPDGTQGRITLAQQTNPFRDDGREDYGEIRDLRPQDDTTDAISTEKSCLIVDSVEQGNSLPSSDVGEERGLVNTGPTNGGPRAKAHLDEGRAPAVVLNDEDVDMSYDLDSDFGDDSGEADSTAESSVRISSVTTKDGVTKTAATGKDDHAFGRFDGAKEDVIGTVPLPGDVASKDGDRELKEARVEADDESDYPADIDKVDDDEDGSKDDHSLSSGSIVRTSDDSNSIGYGERKDSSSSSSSQSSAGSSKSAQASSSGTSGHISESYSAEDGDSAHDDSTASGPKEPRANAVGGSPSSGGDVTDASSQGDGGDNDAYSLGDSTTESVNTARSKQQLSTATDQNSEDVEEEDRDESVDDSKAPATRGDEVTPAAPPNLVEPDTMNTSMRAVQDLESKNNHEAPSSHLAENCSSDPPEVLPQVHAAKDTPMPDENIPTLSVTVEVGATKRDEIYKPNLDEIDTSVDVGDLKRQFGAMLSSSFSQPPEAPDAAGPEAMFAPPGNATNYESSVGCEERADSHLTVAEGKGSGTDGHVSSEGGREDGDDLCSSLGDDGYNDHNGSSNNRESHGVYEDTDGGRHYTQEEWDQYNAEHEDHHGGATPLPPKIDCTHAGLDESTYPTQSQHEAASSTWQASYTVPEDGAESHKTRHEGGGEERVAGTRSSNEASALTADDGDVDASVSGLSGGTMESPLDQQKESVASSSTALEYVATKKENGGDVDDANVEQRKELRGKDIQEVDDLYEIEGLELSSSDSD